jgi:hypothetical protein
MPREKGNPLPQPEKCRAQKVRDALFLASVFLTVFILGCGSPAAKPANAAPPTKSNSDSKESKPPNPDPG